MAQLRLGSINVGDGQGAWPEGALEQAIALQRQLCIAERDWHRLKQQRPRRAAEQLAAALVQLLGDEPWGSADGAAAQQRSLELLEHAARWLRGELSDPGCGRQPQKPQGHG
jgi:hypothetical protein